VVDRQLQDHPAEQAGQLVGGSGQAEDAGLAQRHRGRDRPHRASLVEALLTVPAGHLDLRRQVGRAQPEAERIGVAPATFPEAPAREDGGEQRRSGVGVQGAAALGLRGQRAFDPLLGGGEVAFVLLPRLPVLPRGLPPVGDGVADHHQWAGDGEHQVEGRPQHHREDDAESQRRQHHDHRDAPGLPGAGLVGQLDLHRALGRQQSRRTHEGAGARAGRLDGGVGAGGRGDDHGRVTEPEDLTERHRRLRLRHRLPLEEGPVRRPAVGEGRAVRRHRQDGVVPGHRPVGEPEHPAPTEAVLPHRQLRDQPAPRSADDLQLPPAGRRWERRGRGAGLREVHERAVDQIALPHRLVLVQAQPADVESVDRRARGPPERRGHRADGQVVVHVEDEVQRGAARLTDTHLHPHGTTSSLRPRCSAGRRTSGLRVSTSPSLTDTVHREPLVPVYAPDRETPGPHPTAVRSPRDVRR
jgi:hypothetical protein